MKKSTMIITYITACIISSGICYSQYQIEWINPYPNNLSLTHFNMTNSSTGYILEHDIYFSRISKTTDGGNSWIVKDSSRSYLTGLNFLNSNTGIVSSATRIYKTTNGLNSNQPILTFQDSYIYKSLFLTPMEGYTIGYLPSPFGLEGFALKTLNGGNNWQSFLGHSFDIVLGITFYKGIGFTFGVDSNITKFFWTTDNGASWASKNFGFSPGQVRGYAMSDSVTGFLIGRNIVYRTTDQGINWHEQIRTDVNLNSIGFYNNTGIIICDTGCYYMSNDRGSSWTFYNNVNSINNLLSVSFLDENQIWIGGTGGSVFKTTNSGQNWHSNSRNILKNNLSKVEIVDSTVYIIGQPGVIIKSTDLGKHFEKQNTNSTSTLTDIQFVNESTGFVCGNQIFLKTTNGGVNWQNINTGLADHYFNLSFINENTGWIGSRYGKYMKTTNGGENWQIMNFINNEFITEIYFIDENTGWVGTSGIEIFKTSNGGLNWSLQFQLQSFSMINKIKFLTPEIGAAVSDGSVYLTKDGGTNWSRNNNFGNHDHEDIDIIDSNKVIFTGGFGTVFYTDDFGENWDHIDLYSYLSLGGVKFINESSAILTGSGGAIFKLILDDQVNVKNVSELIPISFSLHQNYPNPFNPKTLIGYTLTGNHNVNLKVYDALGKEIITLVNEKQNAGSYTVNFNGESLSSGIYFYRLEAGDFAATKRMILIK
ncbi:MAG: T9SS type A sorting domain-containing protein [Ignavibacteria bacterium]|nr:T9SS type A sorting domain-containing protein [Ignavibacteria bacterium]